mgnify:FL=1
MSFCSYEEAWGAPFNQNQEKNDHVTKNDEIAHNNIKNKILQKPVPNEDNVMEEVAPLRGSLLGGAIPAEQWKTQEPEYIETNNSEVSTFEANFDKKIDKLIQTIEKCTGCVKGNSKNLNNSVTSWTDVLIFIGLGILAIIVIDMFFKFGKWIVTTQISNAVNSRQQIPQQMPQQIPIRIQDPPMPIYSPPSTQYPFQRGNIPYYPQPTGPPPRGI